MDPLKTCFPLNMGIFHCYVSLPEGNTFMDQLAATLCLVFKAKDSDNDTALEAILSLSQEEPEEDALQAGRFWWHVLKQNPDELMYTPEI